MLAPMTVPDAGGDPPKKIGLVLAGGGARGAYEMGALRDLLPWLAKRLKEEPGWPDDIDPKTWRPHIIVGTSVGALNTAYLAATANEPLRPALDDGCKVWQQIEWGKALEDLVSLSTAKATASAVLDLAKVPGFHAEACSILHRSDRRSPQGPSSRIARAAFRSSRSTRTFASTPSWKQLPSSRRWPPRA